MQGFGIFMENKNDCGLHVVVKHCQQFRSSLSAIKLFKLWETLSDFLHNRPVYIRLYFYFPSVRTYSSNFSLANPVGFFHNRRVYISLFFYFPRVRTYSSNFSLANPC